ncbi:hypothetical protein ACJIZ3_008415 [Penstemon smallii]|uniref:F-box domain-containing protein n=1 Tax=Penstemon smallii TaxID=265156 RepID=A0ABD3T9P6_9LAMI
METAKKEEVNDDVLTSILVRLPPKSVFRFRCVSSKWNNMIADPYFLKSYSAITTKHLLSGERLLPFVQLTNSQYNRRTDFLKRNKNNEPELMNQLVPRGSVDFINSSNGLVLYCSHSTNKSTYHVFNPLTRECVSLPPRKITNHELVPNYTVIWAGMLIGEGGRTKTMDIETYSSKTGTWAMSTLVSTDIFLPDSEMLPLVCNGVVHWTGYSAIALYDPNDGENHLQLIMLPSITYFGNHKDAKITRSERDDVLWYGNIDKNKTMQFWMPPKNKDGSYRRSTTIPAREWSLMHTITNDSLNTEPNISLLGFINKRKVLQLEALISSNNRIVAVLRLRETVFLYNLDSKSIESVLQHGGQPIKWWYDYMETRYLSSYAL